MQVTFFEVYVDQIDDNCCPIILNQLPFRTEKLLSRISGPCKKRTLLPFLVLFAPYRWHWMRIKGS